MDPTKNLWCSAYMVLIELVSVISSETSTVRERMEKRCRQYAESVFEMVDDPILLPGAQPKRRDTCSISTQTTIVGGEEASPREFPHMALIGYRGPRNVVWGCGGSLISEEWVVSAAHCIVTPHGEARFVLLGDLEIDSTEDEDNRNASPEMYQISRAVKHPDYFKPQAYNDIALFKLNSTVRFNRFIRPICLHGIPSPENKAVLASGWGATDFESHGSSILLKAGLEVVENEECRKKYPTSSKGVRQFLPQGVSNETHICAGAEGKDTCQGDSGGPLQQVLTDPYCMYSLLGVTSLGARCSTRRPGIYVRVEHYLPWIEAIVWPEVVNPMEAVTSTHQMIISNNKSTINQMETSTGTEVRIPITTTTSSSIAWPRS
uniref:Peptidase S1 domain-containing protein n=1 Tax=Lygus hesperus TaxID=30085 RepID=A0A0K8TED8_LYGHE